MQSGLLKQWSRSRAGVLCLAGMALAVVSVSGARSYAESIPTETQLRVETSQVGNRSVPTFTVHVESAHAGVVTLLDGTKPVGSATLDADGNATIAGASLSSGSHNIHATFAGAAEDGTELTGSASPEVQVFADATGVPDFTVAPASSSLSVVQGKTVTTILSLTPVNAFSGYVTLSCAQLVTDANCNFVPVNVFVGGTSASPSTLSLETYGVTTSLRNSSNLVYAFLFPGLLGIVGLSVRRRKAFQSAGVALLAIAFIGGTGGCAQRYHYLNKPPQASPGTPLGPKTFTLEAQSISGTTVITHNISMTLTVTAP